MRIVVTTSRKPTRELALLARDWAGRLGARVEPRAGRSLIQVTRDSGADAVLVVQPSGPRLLRPSEGIEYFFHPGMAKVRLHNISAGRSDPMVEAMRLRRGDSVLDCTLGRASDAIVASAVVGPTGRIVGVEIVPVIAELTRHGLQTYESGRADVDAAMRRIEVHCADHRSHLRESDADSFDVVYFDPVFTTPVLESDAMAPLRALADKSSVSRQTLAEALRVARRRVVIKNVAGSPLWKDLGITNIVRGSGSRVEYGVVDARA